jgi:hypothetical protein
MIAVQLQSMSKPHSWYVAYRDPSRPVEVYARTTKIFSMEVHAKRFAAEKLADGFKEEKMRMPNVEIALIQARRKNIHRGHRCKAFPQNLACQLQ